MNNKCLDKFEKKCNNQNLENVAFKFFKNKIKATIDNYANDWRNFSILIAVLNISPIICFFEKDGKLFWALNKPLETRMYYLNGLYSLKFY